MTQIEAIHKIIQAIINKGGHEMLEEVLIYGREALKDALVLWDDGSELYWAWNHTHLEHLIWVFHGNTYEEMCGTDVVDAFDKYQETSFTFTYEEGEDVPKVMPPGGSTDQNATGQWTVTAPIEGWRRVSKPGFFASREL